MIEEAGLAPLRATLEADDYRLDVTEDGDRIAVRISAGPQACADCLVPKPILTDIVRRALGEPDRPIDIAYPGDAP
jgi:hypothetical protein